MSDNIVDARGQACPAPVILTKRVLDRNENSVTTLVDDETSRENVKKLALSMGYTVSVEERQGAYALHIVRDKAFVVAPLDWPVAKTTATGGGYVVFITKDHVGEGSEELGRTLIKTLLFSLAERTPQPLKVLFINSGVTLAVAGSPVLEQLQRLADGGVEIASCGICLDYYEVKDQLAVGEITNMYAILDAVAQYHTVTI